MKVLWEAVFRLANLTVAFPTMHSLPNFTCTHTTNCSEKTGSRCIIFRGGIEKSVAMLCHVVKVVLADLSSKDVSNLLEQPELFISYKERPSRGGHQRSY